MKSLERLEAESLAHVARLPWTLDRCNSDGVTIKDCDGNAVMECNFSDFPSEWGSAMCERTADTLIAQARMIVLLSREIEPKPRKRRSRKRKKSGARFTADCPAKGVSEATAVEFGYRCCEKGMNLQMALQQIGAQQKENK